MKRYAFYLLIMAVAAVAACQKQNDINTTETKDGSYVYTVNASIDNTESKSDYDADGKFSWTEGDAISVLFHNGEDNKFFTLNRTSGTGNSATFSGTITEGYTIGSSDNSGKIWALYPASTSHTYTHGGSGRPAFDIPAVNDLSGSNFSANLPMYDLLDAEGDFSFKYLTCGYKFTINNLDVSKIRVDITNKKSYYLSGDISMSSGPYLSFGNAGDHTSKTISYICDVTAKTAVFYVACRYAAESFQPDITITDYNTGYTIKTLSASKAGAAIDAKGKVQPISISAPGTGSPFVSTLGINWFTDGTIASVDGDAEGVKFIKGTADASYVYIMFCIKRSILTIDPEKYRSNTINIVFNGASGQYFGYLYKQGLPNLHDTNAAVVAKQTIENTASDEVFCEFKLDRTATATAYSADLSAAGSATVQLCIFNNNWATSDYVATTDWSTYKYTPTVSVTLP